MNSARAIATLLIGIIVTSCSGNDQPAMEAATGADRPNIVFILVDDLGWKDVGYLGSEIATPHIDDLAAAGLVLDQNRVFPVCSPTRAALLTGRNPLQFGVDGPMENDAQLPTELTLLPEHLQQAGYHTWMVGKWHLGMAHVDAAPPARGFDYFYGQLGGFLDYYTHVYFGGLDWQRNGTSVREEGHATDLLTADAIRLLDEYDDDKPFFLYLSYNAPHTPLQYVPEGGPDYADIDDADRRVFAQMTTHLDQSMGEFFDALKAKDLFDNTLIIFMSDNGGNENAGAQNGELRAGKASAFDGGVRVPTVISWPAGLEGGRVSDVPVFAQDWLPTLLAVAEIESGADVAEGTNVWGGLARGETVTREAPIVVGIGASKAVIEWPWKLVRENHPDGGTHDQLFDIAEDPSETRDLAAAQADIAAKLAAELDALPKLPSKGARGPSPESLFRDESGEFVHDISMPETREPWAESAVSD